MRRITLAGLTLLVAAFFAMIQFGPSVAFARPTSTAQASKSQDRGHLQLPTRSQRHNVNLKVPQNMTYLGTISKKNGHYMLVAGIFSYKLTDQAQAKKYDGKGVQVVGKLNPQTNKIQVQKIKSATAKG